MTIYICQAHLNNTCFNAILSYHPTLTFSHRVQKSVLYICVSGWLAYRIIVTVFLNSIYRRQYTVLVSLFLAYFTLYNRLWFRHLIRTDSNAFFSVAELYSTVYMYHIFLSPQWASRLLPCPGYCKQCCDEHWGARVSFDSGFLSVYAQQWDCWVIWKFHFQFF